jgi:eukaryotic-like serine/threonine-protein kinase
MDPRNRPKDATEWQAQLAALMRKKTAAAPAPADSAADPTDRTEVFDIFSDSESSTATSQTIGVAARGRWYSRTAGQLTGEWQLVATTPSEVRITGGEVYRFSIHSAGTEDDVAAVNFLAGLSSLRYLNLSFCDGVTDNGLAGLSGFIRLRQLFLRGCRRITDAGLAHLHALKGLHILELTECSGLTPAGIAAVRDALPECKVIG